MAAAKDQEHRKIGHSFDLSLYSWRVMYHLPMRRMLQRKRASGLLCRLRFAVGLA